MNLVQIGQIINTHSIKGEVKVLPLTDDLTLFSKVPLYLAKNLQDTNQQLVTYKSIRKHKGFLLLKLKEVPDLNAALLIKKQGLFVQESDLSPLQDDEFFIHELYGAEVYSTENEFLGKIIFFQETGKGGICTVENENNRFLFPTSKEVFLNFDREKKIATIQLIEGLLELNQKK